MDQTWSEESTIGTHYKNIKADTRSGREGGCQITPLPPLGTLIYPISPMDQTWSVGRTIGIHDKNIKADTRSGREGGCQITWCCDFPKRA